MQETSEEGSVSSAVDSEALAGALQFFRISPHIYREARAYLPPAHVLCMLKTCDPQSTIPNLFSGRACECCADTAASGQRMVSPAKQRRMPALWRTVQQLRKGGTAAGGSALKDSEQHRHRSVIASPQCVAAAVVSPEGNGILSPRPPDGGLSSL